MRVYFSGKVPAFQAGYEDSFPFTRSNPNPLKIKLVNGFYRYTIFKEDIMQSYLLRNLSELAQKRAILIHKEAQFWDILALDLKKRSEPIRRSRN
jgi:hypothetical protein